MTIRDLALRLNTDRSSLHKKIRREKILTTKIPVLTGGGVQWVTVIPDEYAERLIEVYETARKNRG